MIFDVDFSLNNRNFKANFGNVIEVGGDTEALYNEGYEAGKEAGAMPLYYARSLSSLWQGVTFPENTELTIKVKSVSSIEYSFMSSKNLKSVKLISDTPDTVISMNGAFRETYQLELVNLTEFNRKFSSINFCFYANSGALKTILGALDVSECTSFPTSTFQAYKLEDIEFVPNTICANIWFDRCTNLTHDSLMSIINGLKDYSGTGTTHTCTLGSTNLAKLTDEEIAIATEKKGWTLA